MLFWTYSNMQICCVDIDFVIHPYKISYTEILFACVKRRDNYKSDPFDFTLNYTLHLLV